MVPLDLGGIRVRPLLDAEGSFLTFRAAFPAAPLLADKPWTLPFRAFLVEAAGHHVLVDAGIGPPPGAFLPVRQGRLPAELAAAGLEPDDLDVVFFTHLHVDHVGWASIDGRPFFLRARYVASSDDWRFFAARAESQEVFEEKLAPLDQRCRRPVTPRVTWSCSRHSPAKRRSPSQGTSQTRRSVWSSAASPGAAAVRAAPGPRPSRRSRRRACPRP